jgi:cullin 1
LPKIIGKAGKELLWEFMAQWEKHGILTYWMKKIFTYLDRFYLPDHKLPSLSQTGLTIFKKEVFEKINETIVKTIFELIEAEREGEVVDWIKLKKILLLLSNVGID